ncbi:MAG: S9 family peptidase, partial [Deltaproteobacteria bacterium]|nr:S9 family peptidase [Deltaproteobacteria bacterium]
LSNDKIIYLSVGKETAQDFEMNPFTLAKKQITSFPVDIDNLKLSPDGKWILFSAEVYPDCADVSCTVKKDKEKNADPVKAYAYDDLLFRHWDAWEDGKRNHVFLKPLNGGAAVDLMQGINEDTPSKPWGGAEEFDISPDGGEIAYTVKLAENQALHTNSDIYTVNLKTKETKCVTCENKAIDTFPIYSFDGQFIAYLAATKPGFESDRLRVVLFDRNTGIKRILTEKWDRSPGSITWSKDSKKIFAAADNSGYKSIFAIDASSGEVSTLVAEHYNDGISVGSDLLAFTQDSFAKPAEIFISKTDGSNLRQITNMNKPVLDEVEMSAAERFSFSGADGDMVYGWFFKPAEFKEGEKYPLAVFIHGGPQGSFTDHFHYRWNVEIAPGQGFAAAAVDFHGSTGYGQAFTDAISRNWGGKPYKDIMKGLDYVLSQNPWIDDKKVCALGASYGGYMINWIEGQTDKFACLVSHDGEFSNAASYFTTEELWFPEWEFGGTPFENPENYNRWSPDRHIAKWKTPMLVIHGGKDYRLADTEGMSTFTALKRKGVPARFLYFPEENHWVLKPLNSKRWHQEVYDWLKKWTE